MEESFSRSLEYFLSILKVSHISLHNSLAMGSRLPVGDSNTEKRAPINKFFKKYISIIYCYHGVSFITFYFKSPCFCK